MKHFLTDFNAIVLIPIGVFVFGVAIVPMLSCLYFMYIVQDGLRLAFDATTIRLAVLAAVIIFLCVDVTVLAASINISRFLSARPIQSPLPPILMQMLGQSPEPKETQTWQPSTQRQLTTQEISLWD